MIQILLLFLLLSLPGSSDLVAMTAVEVSIGASPSSPQKRKRLDTERHLPPSRRSFGGLHGQVVHVATHGKHR